MLMLPIYTERSNFCLLNVFTINFTLLFLVTCARIRCPKQDYSSSDQGYTRFLTSKVNVDYTYRIASKRNLLLLEAKNGVQLKDTGHITLPNPTILLWCMITRPRVRRYHLNVESSDQDQNIPSLTKSNIKSKY